MTAHKWTTTGAVPLADGGYMRMKVVVLVVASPSPQL